MNRREFIIATAVGVGGIVVNGISVKNPVDAYLVCVSYQTGYCTCFTSDYDTNHENYTTNEKCFDEIARQALKKHKRAFEIELRLNDESKQSIHYWTLAHENNPSYLNKDTYKYFKWYEKEAPHGELRPATFNEI